MHELAHTIGLHHEQTRPDRDEHITLHYENIDQEHWHNFDKPAAQYTTNYGLKYDYRSIMHYGQNVRHIGLYLPRHIVVGPTSVLRSILTQPY